MKEYYDAWHKPALPPQFDSFVRTILFNMPTHCIVFTYVDIQARNIIVNRTRTDPCGPSKIELTIIDWEMSAWYPRYWEFCNAIIINTFHAEWLDIVHDIMVVHTNEYLLMQKIRNILFW
jgi:thiamine kinase-like enzyme